MIFSLLAKFDNRVDGVQRGRQNIYYMMYKRSHTGKIMQYKELTEEKGVVSGPSYFIDYILQGVQRGCQDIYYLIYKRSHTRKIMQYKEFIIG